MTSLPIATGWTEPRVLGLVESYIGDARAKDENAKDSIAQDERLLLQAFRSFAKVAGSLERSYAELQSEVEHLRRELTEKEGELASSLEEKRNERTRLLRILEGLPCGVLVVFGKEKIWKANPEAVRLLTGGARVPEALSELPARLQQLLTSSREEGGDRELELGEYAPGWIAARHAAIAEGMSVFIVRDVTEHKRLEQTEARLKREQALAELSAILAHEVRNPLGSLELFAGLLAEAGLEGEAGEWVERVQGGLRSLAATVNNVLQFHSPTRAELATLDVARLLEWVLDFCGPLARQAGITLSVQKAAPHLALRGDRHGLEQVLLNLVLNSIRAMPQGGWIELGARTAGMQVELTVADNGPGIPAASQSRIFQPGFSTRPGSPGLGLAVCHRIVEQHGGSIQAESNPDRGTIFHLCFPLDAVEKGVA
jgi:two-component system, sensor histidine kinase FlrB